MDREDAPAAVLEAQYLERSFERVEEPGVPNLLSRVNRELLAPIDLLGRQRERFADPVGREGEKGGFGAIARHPLASPAGKIRHENVFTEVKLELIEEDSAAGPAAPAIERTADVDAEARGRARMQGTRARVRMEHAEEHLGQTCGGAFRTSSYVAPFFEAATMGTQLSGPSRSRSNRAGRG